MENEKFQTLVLAKLGELDGKLGVIKAIKADLAEVKSIQQRTEEKVGTLDSKVDGLKQKVDNLGVIIEHVSMDVRTIVEGLSAHINEDKVEMEAIKSLLGSLPGDASLEQVKEECLSNINQKQK